MKSANEWKGALFANFDWQEHIRRDNGKVFWTLLVGPHNLGLERKDNTAYVFAVNESDTIRVNDRMVSLKSYADFLVKNATGDINPRGALVIRCNEVGVGEPTTLTYKDGRQVDQVAVYPVGDYELDIVVRARPKAVSLDNSKALEFAQFLENHKQTQPVSFVVNQEDPF